MAITLTLINADTGADIQTLANGATLNLAALPTRNLSVRANSTTAVTSVKFDLDGVVTTESTAPYALKGDVGGVYNPWTPTVGAHVLKVTPTPGTMLTVNFTVSDTAQPPAPTPTPGAIPRIAVSSDGNANDEDDILASATIIAMLAKSGNAAKLVYYGHSDYIWTADPAREEKMRTSVEETAKLWGGFNLANIFNARAQTAAAMGKLAAEINASTATDHLWIVAAGPMEMVGRSLAAAGSAKHPFVHVISHSDWNDQTTVNNGYTWVRLLAEFSTVSYHRIKDQNGGMNAAFSSYYWLRDSSDVKLRWIWSRSQPVNDAAHGCAEFSAYVGGSSVSVFDASDSGMMHWLINDGYKNTVKNSLQFGDQDASPAKLQAFFTAGVTPTPVPVPLPVSPDGTTISAPTTALLQTADGTWTFGAAAAGGNYITHLNGQTNGGLAVKLLVANGGKLYALNAANTWYFWNNGWAQTTDPTGTPTPTPAPTPTPTPTPTPPPASSAGVAYNVRDFGAKGDGTTDDTAAIQRAVDASGTKVCGKILFPPGNYKLGSSVKFNDDHEMSIIFEGVGDASQLTANFAGYMLDRSNGNPTSGIRVVRALRMSNGNAQGGGIRMMGCVGAAVEHCHITAYRALCFTSGNSWLASNCKLSASPLPGSVGCIASNGVTLINTDIQGYEQGIRHYNMGLQVIGGRIEMCKTGMMLGQDDTGASFQSSAFFIAGTSMERNNIAIHAPAAFGGQITGVVQGISEGVPELVGLLLSGCYNTLVSGCNMGGPYTSAAFDVRGANGVAFVGCRANNTTPGGNQWLLPSDANRITRIQCW